MLSSCYTTGVHSSIPLETNLEGQVRYSQCYMYDINYTDVPTVYSAKTNESPVIPCNNGWVYDTNKNTKTIVMEVSSITLLKSL